MGRFMRLLGLADNAEKPHIDLLGSPGGAQSIPATPTFPQAPTITLTPTGSTAAPAAVSTLAVSPTAERPGRAIGSRTRSTTTFTLSPDSVSALQDADDGASSSAPAA